MDLSTQNSIQQNDNTDSQNQYCQQYLDFKIQSYYDGQKAALQIMKRKSIQNQVKSINIKKNSNSNKDQQIKISKTNSNNTSMINNKNNIDINNHQNDQPRTQSSNLKQTQIKKKVNNEDSKNNRQIVKNQIVKDQNNLSNLQLYKIESFQYSLVFKNTNIKLTYSDPSTYKAEAIWIPLQQIPNFDLNQSTSQIHKSNIIAHRTHNFQLLSPGIQIAKKQVSFNLIKNLQHNSQQICIQQSDSQNRNQSCYICTKLRHIDFSQTSQLELKQKGRQKNLINSFCHINTVIFQVLLFSKEMNLKSLIVPYLFKDVTQKNTSLIFQLIAKTIQGQKIPNFNTQIIFCMKTKQQFKSMLKFFAFKRGKLIQQISKEKEQQYKILQQSEDWKQKN